MAINKVVFGNDTLIDLTEDSVSASNLLEGETAHDRSGASITGTAKQGHVIQDIDGTDLTQRAKLQFADADATDDSTNEKTIVNVVRERTQAQYDAMSAADKAKGIIEITDADAKPLFASQVRYGDGTVEDALDSVISPTYGTETPITSYPYTLPSNGYLKATKLTGTYSERYYRLATFGYLSLESSSGNDLRYFTKGVQILSAYGVDLSFIPFA